MIEKFQQLNQDLTGSKFIQKYEWLGKIIPNKNEINVIELILSYQFDKKLFTGTDCYIAHRVSISPTSVSEVLKRLEKAGMIVRNTVFDTKNRKRVRSIKVITTLLVDLFNNYQEENSIEAPEPIRQPIPETQPEPKVVKPEEKPVEPINTQVEEPPRKALKAPNEGETYPFKTFDFSPRLMMLRYTTESEAFQQLIKDFDTHWTKYSTGIIQLEFLVTYLINRSNQETDIGISKEIEKILAGITQDYQQKAA